MRCRLSASCQSSHCPSLYAIISGSDTKCIIWEHNTHIGDARATDMAAGGLLNIGQVGEPSQNVSL